MSTPTPPPDLKTSIDGLIDGVNALVGEVTKFDAWIPGVAPVNAALSTFAADLEKAKVLLDWLP